MSTLLTRFEVVLPLAVPGTAQDTAIRQFMANIMGLTPVQYFNAYIYTSLDTETQYNIIYGLLTNAQQVTALGFLNTLNSALGSNVPCHIWQVTSEP